jgi:hypothetical protein
MQKMVDASVAFEDVAIRNFELAQQEIDKGAIPTDMGPVINHWVEKGEIGIGNEPLPRYQAALLTAANEYAKVMSGATGAAGATDTSRRETASLFSPYFNAGQIKGVISIAKQEMEGRREEYEGRIGHIQDQLRGLGKSGEKAPSSGATAPSSGGSATASGISTMSWEQLKAYANSLSDEEFKRLQPQLEERKAQLRAQGQQ